MTDARRGASFDAYVQRHMNPLGKVSSNVLPQNSLKNTAQEGDVTTQAKAVLDDVNTREIPHGVVSSAFKCLYISTSGQALVALVKKHQSYIIGLTGKKVPHLAFNELCTIYHVLTASRKYGDVPYDVILRGVVPAPEWPSALLVSFQFFVIQAILQLCSLNLASIARGDAKIKMSVFGAVAGCFLSDSNLVKAIKSLDVTLHSKYYANAIKMIGGFLKVAEVLQRKIQSDSFKLHIGALTLKLAQFQHACGHKYEVDLASYSHPHLQVYIQEFCTETNATLPLPHRALEPTQDSTCVDLPLDKGNIAQLFSLLKKTPLKQSCVSIREAIDSIAFDEKEIFLLTENVISFSKSAINCSDDADSIATLVVAKLATKLKSPANLTQLRQLSRFSFESGKSHSSVSSFAQCSLLDLKCCSAISDTSTLRQMKSRIDYCLARIVDLQRYDLAREVLHVYLKAFEIQTIQDIPLTLFVRLAANHSSLAGAIYGSNSPIPPCVQLSLLEESCAQNEIPWLDCKSLQDLASHLGLISLSTLHKIAEERSAFIKLDDLSSPTYKKGLLYTAIILLLGVDSGVYPFEELRLADSYLKKWFEDATPSGEDEALFVCDILEKLVQMDFSIMALKYSKQLTSMDRISPLVSYKSILLLAQCSMEVGDYDHIPEFIASSGEALKKWNATNKSAVNYNDVLDWKLLQLKYYVGVLDRAKSTSKIEEIKKIFSSRPEFDFSGEGHTNMDSRVRSLCIIAEYSNLVSAFSVASGNHVTSLKQSKFAIKLYSSIYRKFNSLKTHAVLKKKIEKSLLLSYQCAFQSARNLGLAREALFHLDEVKRQASELSSAGSRQFWNFHLAINYELANRHKKAIDEYEKGCQSLWDTPILHVLQLISSIMIERVNLDKAQFNSKLEIVLQTIRDFESSQDWYRLMFSKRSLVNPCIDLDYHLSIQNKGSSGLQTLGNGNSHLLMLLNALMVTRSELSSMTFREQKYSPSMVPNFQTIIPPSSEQFKMHEKLVECKEILMRLLDNNYLSFLDIAQIHDVHTLLNRCVFLLSSFSILKRGGAKDLLEIMFFLKDTANSLPFHHQKLMLEPQKDFLPDTRLDKKSGPFNTMKNSFYADLNRHLPRNWVVVTLDVCHISGNLVISRLDSHAEHPFVVQIPFNRRSSKTTFETFKEEIDAIISESNNSTKAGVTSLVKTKEDRKSWWRSRFELDMRLERCLNSLQQDVLGGFISVFGESNQNETAFCVFRNKLAELTSFLLPDFELSNNMVQLLYNLSPLETADNGGVLDDFLNYLGQSVANAGFEKKTFSKHLPALRSEIIQLYKDLPSSTKQGHLVLIPSFSCSSIPWESMDALRGRSVSRMPSVGTLIQALAHRKDMVVHEQDTGKVLYVVNPGEDLVRTQSRFETLFSRLPGGSGKMGEAPTEEFLLDNVFKNDLFIYMGHGGGEQYLRSSSLMKARFQEKHQCLPPALLMGCSSSAYQDNGRLQETSNIFNWLVCGSPAVVTNLWDVTDKDIDIFSLNLFQRWGLIPGSSNPVNLAEAMTKSRDSCTLKYLNGAAPILHGLPLHVRNPAIIID